jgi:hypothetical protein
MSDLEDFSVLDSPEEVGNETSNGIVHLVALLLTLKLQIDNNAGLIW